MPSVIFSKTHDSSRHHLRQLASVLDCASLLIDDSVHDDELAVEHVDEHRVDDGRIRQQSRHVERVNECDVLSGNCTPDFAACRFDSLLNLWVNRCWCAHRSPRITAYAHIKNQCPRSLTRWGPSRVSDYLPAAALIALTGVVAIMVFVS